MYQTNRGFQTTLGGINAIQSSLGVLQATTAVIGIGTVVGVGLSAVNLWQTLKLRKDIKQLKLEVRDGFIDLKAALKNQGREVIEHINRVAEDIKFEQHRLELIKAYGKFIQATKLIETSMRFQDTATRNIELANARQTLAEALANYNNPGLLSETCAAGQLRRLECAWAIEQTIIMTYQLQNELNAVCDRIIEIQNNIRHDCLKVIDNCQSQEELDFLFPEISCIHNRDLVILEAWKNQVDWVKSLPSSQLELLTIPETTEGELISNNLSELIVEKPVEMIVYEDSQHKSHPQSLIDQMRLMMSSDLRGEYETYISDRAKLLKHKVLNKNNLEQLSNLSVANMYWYFKTREKCDLIAMTNFS